MRIPRKPPIFIDHLSLIRPERHNKYNDDTVMAWEIAMKAMGEIIKKQCVVNDKKIEDSLNNNERTFIKKKKSGDNKKII